MSSPDAAMDTAADAPAVDAPVAAPEVPLDFESALKQVLKTSLYHDGLSRGLHECVKSLDKRDAQLCVLAKSCNEPSYVKLITALCKEHSIPLVSVDEGKDLGVWAGICKYSSEGKPIKGVGASCIVVRSWGIETPARTFILDYIKSHQ